jgi:arsenate reductase-like glutaredoxin family protein
MPQQSGPPVQLFGRKDSRDTQKAIRFFKERRIPVTLVDITVKPPAPTELRRFTERLGVRALADTTSSAWREAGLEYLRMDDSELFGRMLADPRLLRLPLARYGSQVSVGPDEAAWRSGRRDRRHQYGRSVLQSTPPSVSDGPGDRVPYGFL